MTTMPLCRQPQCKFAETGVCLEGYKQACPHLFPEQVDAAVPAPPPLAASPEPRRFHTGEKFTVSETSRVLNANPTRIVLCAGSRESGKTTFLARIGEMFRAGKFDRYKFAWCFTLCGFERASWLATISSGVASPKTKRTNRVENDKFLHLRVRSVEDKSRKFDLLISDLAGETFPTAVSTKDFCVDLQALAACDHLVVFLDSGRLVHQVERHAERDNVIKFLQRVNEVKHNPKNLHVHVIFSRWDYVLNHTDQAAAKKYCDSIGSDLRKKFADAFAALEFQRIAARPNPGIAATDADIQSVFGYWIEAPAQSDLPSVARPRRPARDFSAFGLT